MVLGCFLGLELQKLLIGCLSGAFIYEFLKSHKILSVYESVKILLEREPVHVGPPGRQFGGWAHLRMKSNQPWIESFLVESLPAKMDDLLSIG